MIGKQFHTSPTAHLDKGIQKGRSIPDGANRHSEPVSMNLYFRSSKQLAQITRDPFPDIFHPSSNPQRAYL